MSAPTALSFGRDNQGFNAFAPNPATVIYSATLTNGAAESITMPQSSKSWFVSFIPDPGTTIFVDFTGATATDPAGATFAATTSTQNPGVRVVPALKPDGTTATTISVLTVNATCNLTIEFYENSQNA